MSIPQTPYSRAKKIDRVDAAKMMRQLLKNTFPGVKFSVRLDDSTMRITYSGHPSREDVQMVGWMYEGEGFDGMTDSRYYRTHWLFPDGTTKVAYQQEHYNSPEVNRPRPSRDAILVDFGIDFVFVEKTRDEGQACRAFQQSTRKAKPTISRNATMSREPLDLSEILKK